MSGTVCSYHSIFLKSYLVNKENSIPNSSDKYSYVQICRVDGVIEKPAALLYNKVAGFLKSISFNEKRIFYEI